MAHQGCGSNALVPIILQVMQPTRPNPDIILQVLYMLMVTAAAAKEMELQVRTVFITVDFCNMESG